MDPSPRSDCILLVDEARKFDGNVGSALAEQLDGLVFIRHVYLWTRITGERLPSEPNIVVYTPMQGSTTKDIGARLGEIAARFPAIRIILVTETQTGIKHDSLAASICRGGIPELIAKIKELLGYA